jgi:transcriptional regulator with XRE-family HTH domain
MTPGLRLRQARERLGLTYRDVERASYELSTRRGRPEFILHISRLADIENHGAVPSLHKLYSLAAIYHLDPLELFRWFEVPLDETFHDGTSLPAPRTHLIAPPTTLRVPMRFDPSFDPRRTAFLSRMIENWGRFDGVLANGNGNGRYRYGSIGFCDRRMEPLLRPGSIVLVDTEARRIEEGVWRTEFDRPMYFVEIRGGYRCGWFDLDGPNLLMQPHPLSRCVPERWRVPDEAEVIGRVTGVVTRLLESPGNLFEELPEERGDSNRRAV